MLSSASAWAHAFWLAPVSGSVDIGDRVVFDLRIGPNWPGASTARDTKSLIERFDVVNSTGTHEVSGREGARPVGYYRPKTAGANIAVATSYPHHITLPGETFNKYLSEEGLFSAQKEREKLGLESMPARERFRRNVKALVLVGGSSDGFDREVGLPLELIPLSDPLKYRMQQGFSVRLLRDGRPLAQTQVTATPREQPEIAVRAQTDQNGVATFNLTTGGMWMFYAVDITPAATLDVDWESIWSSLTLGVDPT